MGVSATIFTTRWNYADAASSEHNGIAKVTDALSKLKRLRAMTKALRLSLEPKAAATFPLFSCQI